MPHKIYKKNNKNIRVCLDIIDSLFPYEHTNWSKGHIYDATVFIVRTNIIMYNEIMLTLI